MYLYLSIYYCMYVLYKCICSEQASLVHTYIYTLIDTFIHSYKYTNIPTHNIDTCIQTYLLTYRYILNIRTQALDRAGHWAERHPKDNIHAAAVVRRGGASLSGKLGREEQVCE